MIDVSYEEAVEAIQKATGLSVDEIGRRVAEKLETLGGLVTRDGAIHILANELGVQLVRSASDASPTKINDITLRSRNLLVTGRVVKKYDAKTFNKNGRDGRVASLLLGDETGVTRLVFWNEQVDVWNELKEQDILVVKNPFVKQSYMQDRLELQLNTQSTMVVNPEGVTVENRPGFGGTGGGYQERAPRVQKYIKDLQDGDENVEIVATVVQVYDPRFFDSCPQCNKKVTGNQCATHGEVVSVPNWSMSAFLDDGMGNIRTSFWKQQSLKFAAKTEKEFLVYRDDPTTFEDVKTQLLGEIVKVVGKVKKNDTFDRLEFTANLVFTDVDPQAELEGLQKKFEAAKKNLPEAAVSTSAPATPEQPVAKETGDGLNVVEDDIISLEDLDK